MRVIDFDKKAVYLSCMESGLKVGSAGYLKLEVRDGRCRLDMRVGTNRMPGWKLEGCLPVYLVTELGEGDMALHAASREIEEGLEGPEGQVKVGSISVEKGIGTWTGEYEAERMGGVDLPYSSVQGVVIPVGDGRYIVGSWGMEERTSSPDEGHRKEKKGGSWGNMRAADTTEEAGSRWSAGKAAAGRKGKELWLVRTAAEKAGKKDSADGEDKQPWAARTRETAGRQPDTGKDAEERGSKSPETMWTAKKNEENGKGQSTEKPVVKRGSEGPESMRTAEKNEEAGKGWNTGKPVVKRGSEGPGSMRTGEKYEEAGKGWNTGKPVVKRGSEGPGSMRTGEVNGETGEGRSIGKPAGKRKSEGPESMRTAEKNEETGEGRNTGKPAVDRESPDDRRVRAVLKKKPVYAGEGGESSGAPGWSGWSEPEDKAGRCASKLLSDKWQQLLKLYPNIHPYDDERVYISLEPKDFIILTKEYQHLCNNSFLLHGFYNYRHVILGIEEKRFYLGVPGVYYEREKLVAIMFGFEAFEAPGGIVEEGRFGYYLRRVKI